MFFQRRPGWRLWEEAAGPPEVREPCSQAAQPLAWPANHSRRWQRPGLVAESSRHVSNAREGNLVHGWWQLGIFPESVSPPSHTGCCRVRCHIPPLTLSVASSPTCDPPLSLQTAQWRSRTRAICSLLVEIGWKLGTEETGPGRACLATS